MDFIAYIQANSAEILGYTLEHLRLTMTAVAISIMVGVPLGILISYIKELYKPIVGFANVVQAVPSLALLGFLIPLLGIGALPGIAMVVIYSLLPIVKNTSTGLNNVDRDILEAAKGMGMTRMQILLKVKLPLALSVIMTGVRIAAVTAVGLVTISAFIGAGGLGFLVYSGVRMVNNYQILSGAIPACLMALSIDFLFSQVEGAVTPVSLRPDIKSFDKRKIGSLKLRKKIILSGMVAILGLIVFVNIAARRTDAERTIVIGGKDFTEQTILSNMFARLVEEKTNLKVDLRANLGSTQIVFKAMTTGDLDMYVEYDGTAYRTTLGHSDTRTAAEIYRIMTDEFKSKYNITTLDPIGFNNTYAVMVTPGTAKKYHLKTLSDLAKASPELVVGSGMEFINRSDGLRGMVEKYGMRFKEVIAVDGGVPKYTAILGGQTHVSDAFSTDGTLIKFNMVLLEDDQRFFPPYNAIPVVRTETLQRHPELREVFNLLKGKLDDDKMRHLNYRVVVENVNPRDVANDFLLENGLIGKK